MRRRETLHLETSDKPKKDFLCCLCDCTVRAVAEGGTGVLAFVQGRTRLVHEACKRLAAGRPVATKRYPRGGSR